MSQDGVPFAWFHRCRIDGTHFVGNGEPCNWCGGRQEQEPPPEPGEVERHLRKAFGHE